jgi:hypothetical protein
MELGEGLAVGCCEGWHGLRDSNVIGNEDGASVARS